MNFQRINKTLSAKASQPLEIENKFLGYRLFFQLKNFSFSNTGFLILGNSRFIEMVTSNQEEANTWTKNRERIYQGSVKHLMKSILDRQINRQGFLLFSEKVKGKMKSNNFAVELQSNLVPYDTTSLAAVLSGANEYRVRIKNKIEVHYKYGYGSANYYSDINFPISWLEVSNGYLLINGEGAILNSKDVTISGEMADQRVSSMLPLNYQPESKIITRSKENILAERLREKVYVHTDRLYYYPGDNIWFSAYMNYRVPRMMDTLSKVLYVDLIDENRKSIQSLILQIKNGRAAGCFILPNKIEPGNYAMRAYTQWMRNYGIDQFFYKSIPILNFNDAVNEPPRKLIEDPLLKITFDKSIYKKRSEVKMTIGIDSLSVSNFKSGSFSLSVLDDSLAVLQSESNFIKSNFEFFKPKEKPNEFRYSIEKGVGFEGVYTTKNGRGKKTRLTILPENFESIYLVETKEGGEFSLRGLTFYDSARFGIQPKEGKVVLKIQDLPLFLEKLPTLILTLRPLGKPYRPLLPDSANTILLKDVNITEKKIERHENSYAEPDSYIKSESIETYQNLGIALSAKLPSFKFFNYGTHWYLISARGEFLRGNGPPAEPVLYVDNALVAGQAGGDTVGDWLVTINPSTIDHIEVKGMIGSNMGANGANGAVYVFSKRFTNPAFRGLPIIKVRGFDRSTEFLAPHYESTFINSGNLDYRSTLYWNPIINLTQTPLQLSFFTSDHAGTYRVIIEGLTQDGKTVHTESIIHVAE